MPFKLRVSKRLLVRLRKKRLAILSVSTGIILFTVFQNCGASSNTASTQNANVAGGGGGGVPVPSLIANPYENNFITTSGSYTFIVQSANSLPAMNVQVSNNFAGGFSMNTSATTDCSKLYLNTLEPNPAQCTVTVNFSGAAATNYFGTVTVAYTDSSSNEQPPLNLFVSHTATGGGTGASGATGIIVNGGNQNFNIGNNIGSTFATFGTPTATPPPTPTPAPFPAWTIYRGYTNSGGYHYLQTNEPVSGTGLTSDGPQFLLFPFQYDSSMIPIYRCSISGNRHLTTKAGNCEGQSGAKIEYVLGFAHPSQQAGEIQLYRLVKGSDHLDSTSGNEGVSLGYTPDPTDYYQAFVVPLGGSYTPPSNVVLGTAPLYVVSTVSGSNTFHMSTLTQSEGGYNPGPVIGHIYTSTPMDGNGVVPVFRCNGGYTKHVTSPTVLCPSGEPGLDGLMGWAHSTQQPGEVPLYEFYDPSNGDHMDATTLSNFPAGYTGSIVTVGYIQP